MGIHIIALGRLLEEPYGRKLLMQERSQLSRIARRLSRSVMDLLEHMAVQSQTKSVKVIVTTFVGNMTSATVLIWMMSRSFVSESACRIVLARAASNLVGKDRRARHHVLRNTWKSQRRASTLLIFHCAWRNVHLCQYLANRQCSFETSCTIFF